MTTEEKARAYDEALERAKKFEEKYGGDYAGYIFPELVESEDEKALRIIRKRMCYDPVPISDEDRRIVENWLEKQKEQKHILKFKVGDKVHLEGDDVNILTITGIEKDRYLTDNSYGPILFGAEDIWERIEQKPWKVGANAYFTPEQKQEWSEEDRKHLNSVLLSLNRPFYNMNEQEKSDFDWLHELPERFNLQPKQEWSKEDETYLQDALWCVKQAYKLCKMENDTGTCWSAEKWLKSLRPQYHGDVTMAEAYKMGLEAGKASSWKPSEEQMKAMSYFVRKHQATANRATTKWPEFEAFKSLYNELKKLM